MAKKFFWRKIPKTTLALSASVLFALCVMVGVVAAILRNPLGERVEASSTLADVVRHPLTGASLLAPLSSLPYVYAVMVENAADAWPISGVYEAFLVIEAPVEGSIPRMIAFFSEEAATEKIGPVRSARPYYLDWAGEFDAVYAHVGGSPEALRLIDAYGIVDLNEFFAGEYFYRSTDRFAPHNVYTTMDDLRRSREELELQLPTYDAWVFADGTPSGTTQSLTIDWTSGTLYDVVWRYDAAANRYVREQGGTEVVADNVVVVATDIAVIDAVGRRSLRTLGDGEAMIARNGAVTIGTWGKSTRTERLRFYDAEGEEVAMNAGTTWVEIVASLGQVTVENGAREE